MGASSDLELAGVLTKDMFAATATDLVTYSLEGPIEYDRDRKLYIDADDPSRYLTARQVVTLVRMLVAGLRQAGVQIGDTVVVHSFNNVRAISHHRSLLYPVIFHAIIGSGCRFMGSNPAHTCEELGHQFKLAMPKIVITSNDLFGTVQKAFQLEGATASNIYVLDLLTFFSSDHVEKSESSEAAGREINKVGGCNLYHHFDELLTHGEEDWIRITDEDTPKSSVAAIWSTSAWQSPEQKPYLVIKLITLPYFHGFAAGLIFMDAPRKGETAYVMPRYHLERYLTYLQRYRVLETAMAPVMLAAIHQAAAPSVLRHYLNSLRYIWCGGGMLHEAGMTEAGILTSFLWPEQDDSGSAGRPFPGTEIKLLSDSGELVTTDHVLGEAYVRTPQRMFYYLNDIAATRAAMSEDGFIRTGDVLYRSGGKYFVVDRKKDLIKVRGWQVAPAELEAVLLEHPAILEAAVVGTRVLRNGIMEEAPKAFVVRRVAGIDQVEADETMVHSKGGTGGLTEENIMNYAQNRLASYKALTGGVVFVEALPKTLTGKVRKYRLGV